MLDFNNVSNKLTASEKEVIRLLAHISNDAETKNVDRLISVAIQDLIDINKSGIDGNTYNFTTTVAAVVKGLKCHSEDTTFRNVNEMKKTNSKILEFQKEVMEPVSGIYHFKVDGRPGSKFTLYPDQQLGEYIYSAALRYIAKDRTEIRCKVDNGVESSAQYQWVEFRFTPDYSRGRCRFYQLTINIDASGNVTGNVATLPEGEIELITKEVERDYNEKVISRDYYDQVKGDQSLDTDLEQDDYDSLEM